MPIVPAGSLNTTALVVPNLYVQIVTPRNLLLNGVPSNIIGIVGSASWGPTNTPVVIGSMADYVATFGPVKNRKFDVGTILATAVEQGASDFRCVRVVDGDEVKATSIFNGTATSNCSFVATSLYHGSAANGDKLTLAAGSKASSYKLTISRAGLPSEVYDNIVGSGSTFRANVISAANNGSGATRGRSGLVVLSAGAGSNASTNPSSLTLPLTITMGSGTGTVAGVDGSAAVAADDVIGVDTGTRTGMYALRGQNCSIGVLADVDDDAQWSTEAAFGLQEGVYMIAIGPSGDTVSDAVTTKASAGLDSYAVKLMHGDWLWWSDRTNSVVRLVSPQGFMAGRLANLSPEQSSLNKPMFGIVGSQRTGTGSGLAGTYSDAELSELFRAGIDVITLPSPGGNYWSARAGHNSSSDPTVNGDNYTRMTNFIAATLSAGMGRYVGAVVNIALLEQIDATLTSFLQNMEGQRMLGKIDGTPPYSVLCDASNNPQARTGLGYVQADVQIRYQPINEKFLVNIEGGQTVQVSRQTLPAGQFGIPA